MTREDDNDRPSVRKLAIGYKGEARPYFNRAILTPVIGRREVTTNVVVRWNQTTGEIETLDTVYIRMKA